MSLHVRCYKKNSIKGVRVVWKSCVFIFLIIDLKVSLNVIIFCVKIMYFIIFYLLSLKCP